GGFLISALRRWTGSPDHAAAKLFDMHAKNYRRPRLSMRAAGRRRALLAQSNDSAKRGRVGDGSARMLRGIAGSARYDAHPASPFGRQGDGERDPDIVVDGRAQR